MKILLFCATHRLEPETVDRIFRMDSEGIELDVMFTRWNLDGPEDGGRAAILHNYKKAEHLVMVGGYDYLFCVESDLIPPVDALKKLLAIREADVALGLYLFRHLEVRTMHLDKYEPMWSATRWSETAEAPLETLTVCGPLRAESWGKVIRTTGLGLGCALIKRGVLYDCPFRPHGAHHCDWAFFEDLVAAGKRVYCDTSVICGHKRPHGEIITPKQVGHGSEQGADFESWHLPEARYAVS